MTREATQFQVSSELIEDYLQLSIPPVADDLRGKFQVARGPSNGRLAHDVFAISPSHSVLHFRTDPASNSGWQAVPVNIASPPAASVSKLLAFRQQDALQLLVHYPHGGNLGITDVVWLKSSGEDRWASVPFEPDLANAMEQTSQTEVFEDASGNLLLYGISANYSVPTFFIISFDEESGAWRVNHLEPAASSQAVYRLLPGQGRDQFNILRVEGSSVTYQGASILNGEFQSSKQPPRTVDLHQGALSVNQILGFPGESSQADFLLMGQDATLYLITGYTGDYPACVPLTGSQGQPDGIKDCAVGLDEENLYMIFVLDQKEQRLWLLRQTGRDAAGHILFGSWVPLGNAMSNIACPSVMGLGPEVFGVSLGREVMHMSQNLKAQNRQDGTWFANTLSAPAPADAAPQPQETYSTEAVTADAEGHAVPQTVFQVSADRDVVIIADGIAHSIGPKTPAQLQSNAFGKVTISIAAQQLSAPELSFSSANGFRISSRPDQSMHARLAGEDANFPVNGAALKNAGLLPAGLDAKKADEHAGVLRSLGQSARSLAAAPLLGACDFSKVEMPHFRLNFETPEQIQVHSMTANETAMYLNRLTAAPFASMLSDIWGDVANFFKHTVEGLREIIVSAGQGVVNLMLQVGESIKTFVLNTVNQLADALEAVCAWFAKVYKTVGNAIQAAVRWLRKVFAWEDVINTKKVLKYCVNSCFDFLETSIEKGAVDLVSSEFTKLKTSILTSLDNAEQAFGAGTSFNQFADQQPNAPPGGNVLKGQKYHDAYAQNSVQCNYVQSKSLTHVTSQPDALMAASPLSAAAATGFQDFLDMVKSRLSIEELQPRFQKFQDFLQSATSSGKSFFDVAMVGLIEVAKELIVFVLDTIEEIIVALLKLVGAAIGSLKSLLNAGINIPVISWLYKKIAGEDMSLMDLICLMIATPITILGKVLFGGKDAKPLFSPEKVKSMLANPLPWPALPSREPQRLGAEPVLGSWVDELDRPGVFLVVSLVYAIVDVLVDNLAYMEAFTPDAVPRFAGTVFSCFAIVLGLVLQVFGGAWDLVDKIFKGIKLSAADVWSFVSWLFGFLTIGVDIVFTAASDRKSVARLGAQPWSYVIPCVFGVIGLALGIGFAAEKGSDENYSGWDVAEGIVSPIPSVAKPLLASKAPEAFAGLLFIDILCDLATGVIHFVGAQAGPETLARADFQTA